MVKSGLKMITLYATLVAVSAAVIATHLQVSLISAAATASIGCVFKTFATLLHNFCWERLNVKVNTTK